MSEPTNDVKTDPQTASSGGTDTLLPRVVRQNSGVFLAVGLGLALVGLLRGFQHRELPPRVPPARTKAGDERVPPALTYSQLPTGGLKANAGFTSNLPSLQFERPGVFDAVVRTEDMKQAALADRARNRAYDGAPPTVPHPVQPGSDTLCLSCHRDGIKVGDRVASKVSHPPYTNCTQCHAEADYSAMRLQEASREGSFVGVYRAGPGGRASPGAPPTIPHATWMRQDCTSCHGVIARPGLRTTHPWLTNCVQCHAPSAELDQVAFPPLAAVTSPSSNAKLEAKRP
ncbi:MAG: hypothetical protein U0736_27730 [Gemmataceae bacterium]